MHTLPITLPGEEDASCIELQSAALSDVGQERERNEDQFLIATLQRTMSVGAHLRTSPAIRASIHPRRTGGLPDHGSPSHR